MGERKSVKTEALDPLLRATELNPLDASLWDNLALACSGLGRYRDAQACLERALRLAPDSLSAWVNLSANARKLGDLRLAIAAAERALGLDSLNPQARLNLANAMFDAGRVDEAEAHLRRALQQVPGWSEALLSLSAVLELSGRPADAVQLLEANPAIVERDWRLLTNAGRQYWLRGDTQVAASNFRRAVELNGAAFDAFSGLLFMHQHDENIDHAALFDLHLEYGRRVAAAVPHVRSGHDNDRDPERNLRLGFVSGDLRRHAVAHFIEPYFNGLRGSSIEIFAYANQRVEDAVSDRLKGAVAGWRNVVALSDEELADLIRQDRIDVLMDLSGHTHMNRLPVFARKPAPVQMSWLGYPGTTGLAAIDYRLVYGGAAPRGLLDAQFVEKLIRMPYPSAFQQVSAATPEPGTLPALRNGFLTFANFNRPSKVGERVIALWSRILREVPNSRMILGACDDVKTADVLRARFKSCGVDPERLDLRPYLPLEQYLEAHREVDFILDSFPYAGGTTTQHALRMGVPSVTLAGATLAQRAGAGSMSAAGLHDWVAEFEEEYVSIAVRKSRDLDALARLREELPLRLAMRDPLDSVASFEMAIRMVWRRWCEGLPAESMDIPGRADAASAAVVAAR